MISGSVVDSHVLVYVTFRFYDRSDLGIQFVVDTGFTDYLCLPPEAVAVLVLPFQYDLPANLADDSEVLLPVYVASILWNGQERRVRVLATGRRPLLGTALLDGHVLTAEFTEDGRVTIDNL